MTQAELIFDPKIDQPRLDRQLDRVAQAFRARPGQWLTLDEIAAAGVPGTATAHSARLRDLCRLHGWTKEKRHLAGCPLGHAARGAA